MPNKVQVAREQFNKNFTTQPLPVATQPKKTVTDRLVLDVNSQLPKVTVRVESCDKELTSKLFAQSPTKSKALRKNEKRLKAVQDSLKPDQNDIPWYGTYNKLTGFDIQVRLVASPGKREATTSLEALQAIDEPAAKKREEADEVEVIEFDDRRADGLPKSIKEKHELPRSSKKRDKKANEKSENTISRNKSSGDRSSSGLQDVEASQQKSAVGSRWGEVYSSAKGSIAGLMSKQAAKIENSKKKDKKKKKGSGDGKKFKLGFNV